MKSNKKTNGWRRVFMSTPGPNSGPEAFALALKGLCMGAADIIPGVSGGTIALITGIYERLLNAIRSVNIRFFNQLGHMDFKGALAEVHLRFLVILFCGILVSILSLARLMNYLLHYHPVYTWGLFFGLICASVVVVGQRVSNWDLLRIILALAGGSVALVLVNLIPVDTPNDYWFILVSGAVAICAMILPGISGAFILLILGKYEFVTATLKNPFDWDNFRVIVVFAFGCVCGLAVFSRFLSFLLKRYRHGTMAFLTGLMAGSLWKIWPWKMALTSAVIRGKVHVLTERNLLPTDFNTEVVITLMLALGGAGLVLALERWAKGADR